MTLFRPFICSCFGFCAENEPVLMLYFGGPDRQCPQFDHGLKLEENGPCTAKALLLNHIKQLTGPNTREYLKKRLRFEEQKCMKSARM